MKQTRWLTEAKAIADQVVTDGLVCYIAETGQYTPWPENEGYVVISVIEAEELCKKWTAEESYCYPDDYTVDDWASDYCLYATNDSIEPNLEPEREEVEHYLTDYHTDYYQRDMPTGDSTIGLLFYAKVNPQWSELVEDLIDQIKELELAKTSNSAYQYAVKGAIDNRIAEVYWHGINWAYECWEGNIKDNYHWIESVGRVGRSGGNIKIISSWPETTKELQEIAQDCAKIKAGIDAEVKWLESEERQLTEYKAAFDMHEMAAVA